LRCKQPGKITSRRISAFHKFKSGGPKSEEYDEKHPKLATDRIKSYKILVGGFNPSEKK
jgi:hypothetical protein